MIYCKGWMSKRGQNPPQIQDDSHSSVADLSGFAEGRLYNKQAVAPANSQCKANTNRGTALPRKKFPPFPHATPEGGTR